MNPLPFPSPLAKLRGELEETLDAQRAIAVESRARLTDPQVIELRDWLFEQTTDLLVFLAGGVSVEDEARILDELIGREP